MSRVAYSEASLESVLSDVKAYSAVAGHYDSIFELEQRISLHWNQATQRPFTFEDHSLILGRKGSRSELSPRWSAWIAQHVFRSRASCVGNFIVEDRDGRDDSPLVRQLSRYGIGASNVNYGATKDLIRRSDIRPHKTVDGLIILPGRNEVVVFKHAQIERRRSVDAPTLFNPRPQGIVTGRVSSRVIATLIKAHHVLRQAVPTGNVRCVVVQIDPTVMSREYYAYDVSDVVFKDLTQPTFDLSTCPLISSAGELLRSKQEIEGLAGLPDFIVGDPLMRLPVDRAARAMMALEVLWQAQAGRAGLICMTVAEIAKAVQQRFMIEYTVDHQRHDLEDCLENGQFIEQPAYESKCFGLTPLGVFQALVARRMLQLTGTKFEDPGAEAFVLAPVRRQARLWARYHRGEQVIESII